MRKKLSYFANVDKLKSPGVLKKIENTIDAADRIGFMTRKNLYDSSFKGRFSFLKELSKCDSDFIFIRFDDLVIPFSFFIIIYLRSKGAKIIIDVPTPRSIGLREIDSVDRSFFYKIFRKFLTISLGSWFLIPANRVVQYADEGWWFNIGIKNKTIKVGNGILIDNSVPLVSSSWPSNELKLIGVAQIANWHGYDRVIKALSIIKIKKLPYTISFTIVGDGDERDALESLVKELGLEDLVFFTGMLVDKQLNSIFEGKHIGVASLGLFRKGLSYASDLKTREYMARGLLVLGVGSDPDIEINSPYRATVSNSEDIDDIVDFLTRFTSDKLPLNSDVRCFAEKKLSIDVKISDILNGL